VGPIGVAEVDPVADGPFGPETVGQIVPVGRLVLGRG